MNADEFTSIIGPALSAALERKGYTELTAVQEAVLDPELAGRDLRITSQTGSGKTVAIGFALRDLVLEACPAVKGVARPRALVVAPTRELAQQVEEELTWLFAEGRGRLASTTGGASYRDEHRALSAGPAVIVGTPGRMLDHLDRGSIDTSEVGAIVLDEADRMLDLGFREALESILSKLPAGHRTHLVSATFPRDVRALADRVQKNAAHVEGTRLGTANTDIAHVICVVEPRQKVDAIVNLLLANPDAQTLVFDRTRAGVASIADELAGAGFAVSSLSGEMDQRARNRALASFKNGDLHVLVATDVAARGIDVQDIARVIHVDLPTNADSYTHRSGRTGRAGRQGTSVLLVVPSAMGQATRLLRFVGVPYKLEPIPTADAIRHAGDQRAFDALTKDDPEGSPDVDAHNAALAERLVAAGNVPRIIARLLTRVRHAGAAEPRDIRAVSPSNARQRPSFDRPDTRGAGPRRGGAPSRDGSWVPFRVSWGGPQGADARRLLALVCRRGGINGSDVGIIDVDRSFSIVNVAAGVAEDFAAAAGKPDPRDPRVVIQRATGDGGPRAASPAHARPPPAKSAPSHARPAPAKSAPAHARPAPAKSAPSHARPAPAKSAPAHVRPAAKSAPAHVRPAPAKSAPAHARPAPGNHAPAPRGGGRPAHGQAEPPPRGHARPAPRQYIREVEPLRKPKKSGHRK
jgi:ATP-dependent RNA helicase DeaD